MANVLIIGASRGIGLEATKQSLSSRHHVRAFARSAISIHHCNLEKRKGDALEQGDVSSALEGMDVVIQSLGISLSPQFILGPVTLFSDATRILVSAMEASGVKRLICVTGYGSGDSRASIGFVQAIPFHLLLGRVYDNKDAQKFIIKRCSLDWVIVRPGFLTNGPRTGSYQVLVERQNWRNGLISRADVADFLVGQIDDDRYIRQTPVLAY